MNHYSVQAKKKPITEIECPKPGTTNGGDMSPFVKKIVRDAVVFSNIPAKSSIPTVFMQYLDQIAVHYKKILGAGEARDAPFPPKRKYHM